MQEPFLDGYRRDLLDLKEVEEGLDLGVEVADSHIVKCTARGIVEIFKANLHGVI